MAEEIRKDETPEPEPMAGPGAAVDQLVEEQTGLRPGETAPGLEHAGPGGKTAEEEHHPSEHSPWPIVLALAMSLIGVGLLSHLAVSVVGIILLMVALIGWLWEPWVS